MPAVAALDGHKVLPNSLPSVNKGRGPAIWMERPDRLQTKTRKGKVYRDWQREMLKQGKWCDVIKSDVADVRKIARKKYNKNIRAYNKYFDM